MCFAIDLKDKKVGKYNFIFYGVDMYDSLICGVFTQTKTTEEEVTTETIEIETKATEVTEVTKEGIEIKAGAVTTEALETDTTTIEDEALQTETDSTPRTKFIFLNLMRHTQSYLLIPCVKNHATRQNAQILTSI